MLIFLLLNVCSTKMLLCQNTHFYQSSWNLHSLALSSLLRGEGRFIVSHFVSEWSLREHCEHGYFAQHIRLFITIMFSTVNVKTYPGASRNHEAIMDCYKYIKINGCWELISSSVFGKVNMSLHPLIHFLSTRQHKEKGYDATIWLTDVLQVNYNLGK